jgi:radical S-adenosyl methionine domain-containing protein 2
MPIETVNLHVVRHCNLRCRYCYGGFPERPPPLDLAGWCLILDEIHRAEVRRVTFSGGEPTLHRDLLGMIEYARGVGLQTGIITNARFLTDAMLAGLDLVGITLDSADEETLVQLGRKRQGEGSYVDHVLQVAARARLAGARLKVNTVVTALNVHESLTHVLLQMTPEKWKPLQFTHVPGENDAAAADLRVSDEAFDAFVERHRQVLEDAGVWVAPERDGVVRSTYVMIDPSGRVFRSGPNGYVKSEEVSRVGLRAAIEQVGGYDRAGFRARGGHVDVLQLGRGKKDPEDQR